jgi:hypothetical protein
LVTVWLLLSLLWLLLAGCRLLVVIAGCHVRQVNHARIQVLPRPCTLNCTPPDLGHDLAQRTAQVCLNGHTQLSPLILSHTVDLYRTAEVTADIRYAKSSSVVGNNSLGSKQ